MKILSRDDFENKTKNMFWADFASKHSGLKCEKSTIYGTQTVCVYTHYQKWSKKSKELFLTIFNNAFTYRVGVKVRNSKVDCKAGGTWRRVGQSTLIMNILGFFYSTKSFSLKMPAYKQKFSIFTIFVYTPAHIGKFEFKKCIF